MGNYHQRRLITAHKYTILTKSDFFVDSQRFCGYHRNYQTGFDMEKERVVYVKCVLTPGNFSKECFFRIAMNVGEFVGIAPIHYCLQANREKLVTQPIGEQDGFVVGVQIGRTSDGTPRIHLPDGQIYDLTDEHFDLPEGSKRVPV